MSDYRTIPLSQGYVALVDVADYEDLARHTWQAHVRPHTVYARRSFRLDGRRTREYMHRRLLPGVEQVDHINGNGLDNRRANLRPATHAENQRNRTGLTAHNKSGFRGVHWSKQAQQWRAQIQVDGRVRYLGCFDDPEDAARVFDTAAIELFGEFAGHLNFAPSGGAS